MNALLQIQVRVAAQQANAALNQVQNNVKQLQNAASKSGGGGFMAGMGAASKSLVSMGKNMQWTGRQLTMNFTLPLALAAGAATKWALENERAFTQVSKVYGDLSMDKNVLESELTDLRKSFELLSTRFGVHQAEVIEIAAAWAQAGSSGLGLAKSVRLTLEAMILGGGEWQQTVEGMIGIQSAYKLNTDQLKQTMADLNIIENQTGISLVGLIEVISRAGGTARTAGISIKELASMAAALVPAAGSAAQAGNALRTMISRIMAPTKESAELMGLMGINIFDATWQAQDGMGRIETLAGAFMKLDDAQKTVVSSSIASRWQINRFDLLMEQIDEHIRSGGTALNFFSSSMRATANEVKAMDQYNKELLIFLGSAPKQFDILTNLIKNELATAIQPMLPIFLMFLKKISELTQAFNRLSPSTKAWILVLLVALAAIGPLMTLLSSFIMLIGVLGIAFSKLGMVVLWVARTALPFLFRMLLTVVTAVSRLILSLLGGIARILATVLRTVVVGILRMLAMLARGLVRLLAVLVRSLLGVLIRALVMAVTAIAAALGLPIWAVVAIIVAVVAIIVALFNDDIRGSIGDFFAWLGRGLAAIPGWFASVGRAIARIVGGWVEDVVEALSYLNPFARHSPSLVDNVTKGIAVILSQYSRLRSIPGILGSAMHALERFNDATAPARRRLEDTEYSEMRTDVVAAAPNAGGAFDDLVANIRRLRPALAEIRHEIDLQEMVVKGWTERLEEANQALEAQEDILDDLQTVAKRYKEQLDTAQERLEELANTPIEGMDAMADAIFENEMAQKRLRLEMLRMGDVEKMLDNLRDRINALQGDIENMRAHVMELRAGGAGSEILGPLEAEIAAMEAAQQAMRQQATDNPITQMQKDLDDLQRQGEILALEESLQFDPLRRQIEDVTNAMEEMPFDTLMTEILAQQNQVKILTGLWEEAEAAVVAQEQVVETYRAERDRIQGTYDAEKLKLDELKEAYSTIEDQLRGMESALNELASSAAKANDELSQAQELFTAAEGFNFEDVGGTTGIGREVGDIKAWNAELQKEIDDALSGMDFGEALKKPFRDAWNKVKETTAGWVHSVGGVIGDAVKFGLGDEVGGWVNRNFSREGVENFIGSVIDAGSKLKFWGKDAKDTAEGPAKDLQNSVHEATKKFDAHENAAHIASEKVKEFGAVNLDSWKESLTTNLANGAAAFDGVSETSKKSMADIKAELIKSITDTQTWHDGLVEIAKEGHPLLAAELSKMGPAGAAAVQEARNMAGPELDQFQLLFQTRAQQTGQGFATNLQTEITKSLTGGGTAAAALWKDEFIAGVGGVKFGVTATPVPLPLGQSGGIYRGAQAIVVGEGSRVHAEYLIPTDPRHRARALELYQSLSKQLFGQTMATGALGAGGGARQQPIMNVGTGESREIHFHGDLVFPNISEPHDAEKFIKNLQALSG